MTVYDSSKGKSLKCITRDKRVPLFHSHHNRAHTESSHQRNLPNVCLEHTWHLARGSLIKPSLNMNESHITVLQRHRLKMFSTLLSIIHPAHDARDKGKGWKWQVPKKFSDKNQSAASSHQRCQTENPSAPLARDGVLPLDPFFINWILKCFNALPQVVGLI